MSKRERDSWRRRGEQYAAFIYVVTIKVCVCWGRGESRVEMRGWGCGSGNVHSFKWIPGFIVVDGFVREC